MQARDFAGETMSAPFPACPQCGQGNTYPDGPLYICPDCAFEWPAQASSSDGDAPAEDTTVRDAHGTPLADGDAVIVVKDLKLITPRHE